MSQCYRQLRLSEREAVFRMKAAKLPSGTLYPMLARLQEQGLVESEWEEPRVDANGRPPRKYYRLSVDGDDAFGSMAKAWLDLRDAMDSLLRGGSRS